MVDVLSKKTTLIICLIVGWKWIKKFRDIDMDFQPLGDSMLLASMSSWESEIVSKIREN